ncbi:MAG: chemotaxis protein CheA [Nitrospirae bacterium]|nr:chemotaxis protein CheA [Nitrospirota bacterium]
MAEKNGPKIQLEPSHKVFIEEATEILQTVEDQLLTLETTPNDSETINALFRGMHTIKGASGMLGLTEIAGFTHKLENLMEKVRNGEIPVDAALINLLLRCRDHIIILIKAVAIGELSLTEDIVQSGEELTSHIVAYLDEDKGDIKEDESVKPAAEAATWHISMRFNKNVLRDGLDPVSLIHYLRKRCSVINFTTITDSIPQLSDLDPEDCLIGFEVDIDTTLSKQEIEDIFEFYAEENTIKIIPPHSEAEAYIKLINDLPEDTWKLGEILIKSGLVTQNDLNEALMIQNEVATCAQRPRIGEVLVETGKLDKEVVKAALDKQQKIRASAGDAPVAAATIRVDAEKLDQLITLVGELVVANGGMRQRSFVLGDSIMMKTTSFMTKLVNDIREMSMKMRMIPIGTSFNRFQRLVRDISKEFGKDIELAITGGDTELDKTVIEKINDPLTHIVRNSVDHGIETIEDRLKAGKPAKGTVTLNACYDAGTIVIEITDDGKGLSKQKIMDKAVKQGLVEAGKNLTDKEIFGFIFEPGFSTAESVTSLSGRGVGMDVVRRNIEALRGVVFVESEEGRGTKVKIQLPLTLSIIDGFMIGIGGKQYVIPLDMVVKCYNIPKNKYEDIKKKGYFDFQGKVIPFLSLCEMFELAESDCRYIVIVNHGGRKAAIGVDNLYGDMQAVIKSLGRLYKDYNSFSGATILGDGSVALILDINGIYKQFEKEGGHRLEQSNFN